MINSGNANAATGAQGLANAEAHGRRVRPALLGCRPEQVLVASTGVIGHQLPMDKLEAGLDAGRGRALAESVRLSDGRAGHHDDRHAAQDRLAAPDRSPAGDVTLLGIAKGAAMIGPRMATMLGVPPDRRTALGQRPAGRSSPTPSNVVQLPVGRGARQHQRHGPPALEHGRDRADPAGRGLAAFAGMVRSACETLARQIADDGEGATHFITIDVEGCGSFEDAPRDRPGRRRQPAGEDRHPWRRPQLGPDRLGRRLRRRAVSGGGALALDQRRPRLPERHARPLRRRAPVAIPEERSATCICGWCLTSGSEAVRFWTCDLTAEYIRLNADYTT